MLVLCSGETVPLTLGTSSPTGALTPPAHDDPDDKIIAIPVGDPTYNGYTDISQLPAHVFDEMTHFFSVYKMLERKKTVIDEAKGAATAIEIIEDAIERYKELYPDK